MSLTGLMQVNSSRTARQYCCSIASDGWRLEPLEETALDALAGSRAAWSRCSLAHGWHTRTVPWLLLFCANGPSASLAVANAADLPRSDCLREPATIQKGN